MRKQKNKEEKQAKDKKYISYYSQRDVTVYFVLRFLVILVMIRQIFTANWNNVFLCILTLILFLVPVVIDRKFNIRLPNTLETIILLFIFSAEILGEINEFYLHFAHWDTILHTLNGFLCAAIGFSMIDILNRKEVFHTKLSPIFVALVAFCFSMTVGVLWEFFEFGMDRVFKYDMQKDEILKTIATVELNPSGKNIAVVIDNIEKTIIQSRDNEGNLVLTEIDGGYLDIGISDTMKDLIVNFIGAIVFSILGLLYIKNKDEYKFAEQFIPVLKRREKEEDKKIQEE
ncbi:MAG TPA: hypothetical protein IAD08_07120 [Candidatus Scatovivens faecipullorum]|nr:hypothetical protein [Candidatus Scatovivens faecipullorum]